ncbi:MAG TPA: polysaccharide biosynthesis protein [Actinomycetaceae bacterium]|nr:polysaccharide biosynthesis protein [Actinomycetaceae bacterium]
MAAHTDVDAIPGTVVTITGGTGSFGSTMAAHLLVRDVARLNIFSRDEAKQDDIRRRMNEERLCFFLGDVRDYDSIVPAVRGADFVFHAAALKQVPSCEFFLQQSVFTNVTGSANVIRAADAAGVRTMVCLSTDKAVYPVNAMGMTKALMEKTAKAFARNRQNGMTIALTRYGNVMWSRGSVIPLFIEHLRGGRPLTITEPLMTRFLMSLAESVDLVDHAFAHACQGDLFVRKAPASTVEDLALAVAGILGVDDPPIQVIGIRHGEKMYETLLSAEEMVRATDEGDYFRVPLDTCSLQYELYFEKGSPRIATAFTSENTVRLGVAETRAMLEKLPEVRRLGMVTA